MQLSAGVRQGGILSPLLSSAFIDGLLSELDYTKLGCFLNGRCLNSFLYADDLLLLSPSITDLQLLVDKASSILKDLDLQINLSKSCALRVGARFSVSCGLIKVDNEPLPWVKEAKYLGLTISASSRFICNWQPIKRQFFIAVNRILSSLGSNPNLSVVLSLFQSTCVPILSYGIAALALTKTELHGFTFAYNNIFHKLFKINNKQVIEQCQFFCGALSFQATYDFLRFSFLRSLCIKGWKTVSDSLLRADYNDLLSYADKYNFKFNDSNVMLKFKIWTAIEHSLNV